MKKKSLIALCMVIVMLVSCMAFFVGCDKNTPEDTTPKEYTIQYTDDSGTHQITVTAGMPYSLEVIPERTGYVFAGLFDAEVGGTQYVSSTGASISPFNDGKNIVLFPQFRAKDYTVILDYQGSTVTGGRQFTVAYGSSLPELPKNLTAEHKEFVGWYTQANCEGTQVADKFGLIPVVSVLNDTNFDLSGEYVYLYAGFEVEKFTVTCCFEAGMDTEDVKVEYDTPVNQIVPNTRVNGQAPLTWSKTQGGEVFNGKVTGDMVLYAVEYAPVIELDSNGGSKVKPVVARAGSTISLPTPTKEMAKFAYWEDMQGNKFTSATMPNKSLSLKAVWQAKLVFDENGGSDVDDISVAAGNKIILPTPEKDGFVFAGWYTAEKEQYTSTTMPSAGIKLKAGWYKEKIKIYGSSSSEGYSGWLTKGSENRQSASWRQEWDLSEIIPPTGARIHIKYINTVRLGDGNGGKIIFRQYYYDNNIIGESYCLGFNETEVNTTSRKEVAFETDLIMKSDTLYVAWYAKNIGTASEKVYFKRVSLEVTYPDTTNLYL